MGRSARKQRMSNSKLSRKPPAAVRRQLRSEVGFGCPFIEEAAGSPCGNPYLEWAHFDPPWEVRHHHNPHGMIALCHDHHAKADAGALTIEQWRNLKELAQKYAPEVKGRFEW